MIARVVEMPTHFVEIIQDLATKIQQIIVRLSKSLSASKKREPVRR